MAGQLVEKTCVVTGATGLIGKEICRSLLANGATVIAIYNSNPDPLDDLEQNRLYKIKTDLVNQEAIEIALKELSGITKTIDVLVACAGKTIRRVAMVSSNTDYDSIMDLNFKSLFQLVRSVLRPMYRSNSGRIILIGSVAGSRGLAGQSLYAASKGAINSFAQSLAQEVGEKQITVNVVAPGAVNNSSEATYSKEEQAAVLSNIALRRLAEPCEIANVVSFLASDNASYVSGAIIPVDGCSRF
ncbi:MAG: SDR family oxidoreductase [Gammaproteobacteria bacterium]|nr:SDR family oxidoreductase [Gammaproteobacteria bacterium]